MINRIKVFIIIISIVVFGTATAFSEQVSKGDKISVEKILKKYLDAVGGKEKLMQVNSKTMVFNVFMEFRQHQSVRTIHRKGTLRNQIIGQKRYMFFDGNKLWHDVSGNEKKELTGPVVAQFRKMADLDGPFINYKQKGITIKYAGKKRFGFVEFLNLEVTWKDKVKKYFYFDPNSGLLKVTRAPSFWMDRNQKTHPGPDSLTYFYDYREVKGIKYPFAWIQTDEKLTNMHLFTVENITLDMP